MSQRASLPPFVVFFLASSWWFPNAHVVRCAEPRSLNETMVNVTLDAMTMSVAAYFVDPDPAGGFQNVTNFLDGPDQAVLARKDGRCYLAFRGTIMSFETGVWNVVLDWAQVFDFRESSMCRDDDSGRCCTVHRGYHDAYHNTAYTDRLEESVRDCAANCRDDLGEGDGDDDDGCVVVLTGHSQGGAVANLAAVALADLNPYVVTFGQTPVFSSDDETCDDAPPPERVYRYVITKDRDALRGTTSRLVYDVAPMLFRSRFRHRGGAILLGNGVNDVAYLGPDAEDDEFPCQPIDGFLAHFPLEYMSKINELETVDSFPVVFVGFSADHPCTKDEECASGTCDDETCA